MVILQAGAMKCGNFWLYCILQNILKHSGLEHRSFFQQHPAYENAKKEDLLFPGQADIDHITIKPDGCYIEWGASNLEPIQDIDDYVRQCRHVWTHSPVCPLSLEVYPKFDRIVYIIRDPRDAAISFSKFAFTPHRLKYYPHYETGPDTFLEHNLDGLLRDWVHHVGGYLKHAYDLQIHVVFYERLLHSFDTEVSRLLNYLDLELDMDALQAIKHDVAFDTMSREAPHHLRKGQSNQWMNVLTESQKQYASRLAGPMIKLLNYPFTDESQPTLPCLPATLNLQQIEAAMAPVRRTFSEEIKRVCSFLISDRTFRAKITRIRNWNAEKYRKVL